MSDKKDPEKLRKISAAQQKNYRKARANIFMENAIQNYIDANGVQEMKNRLKYYLKLLEGAE